MSSERRRVEVVGYLTEEEAFRFVVGNSSSSAIDGNETWPGLIIQNTNTPKLEEGEWQKVWAVCGGNMFLLHSCVQEACRTGSWDKGEFLVFISVYLF